jgi:cytochrome c-type biogenesis protein CcmF|tara:strand:- start:1464 stop:3377 length:1914 start_codon:yes stop_codon:yes gene_type:complete
MFAELGIFFLILTFLISSLGFVIPLYFGNLNQPITQTKISKLIFCCTLSSFFLLTYCFITSDFSLEVVQKNSNSQLPMIYKITGVWGNHEGSILLWLLIMTFFGLLLSNQKKINTKLKEITLSIQNTLIFLVSSFILWTSNPFERTFPPSIDGADLNPLLQDPGLIIHPPFLYLGYVGFSIVYSLALAILILNQNKKEFFENLRPWIFISWTFLTCGIGLGSWWAYYELGWGGFWFWDPVENASLLPWLTASALLHTVIISSKNSSLQNWTIFLSITTFLLSLLGTFLVRSGVLVSVHAFANDPTRGIFILLLLMIVTGIGFFFFLRRSHNFSDGIRVNLISREGAISLNNIFMLTLSFTILLGTIYPLISNVFFKNKISIGAPFFNSILSPLMLPVTLGMMLGPFMRWGKDDIINLLSRLSILLIVLVFVSLFVWYLNFGGPILSIIFFILSAWIIISSLFEFSKFISLSPKVVIKKIPLNIFSQSFAHIGIALIMIGATGSSILKIEKIQFQEINQIITLNNFDVKFLGVKLVEEDNYVSQMGHFEISKNNSYIKTLYPEKRMYNTGKQVTTEASIYSTFLGDLYIAIGENNSLNKNSWTTRIWFNPFTIWIWIGVLFLVIGGMVSLTRIIKNKK